MKYQWRFRFAWEKFLTEHPCEITFLLAFAYWCNEIKEGISPVVVSDICHPKEKKITGSFNKTVLLFTSSSQSQLFVT